MNQNNTVFHKLEEVNSWVGGNNWVPTNFNDSTAVVMFYLWVINFCILEDYAMVDLYTKIIQTVTYGGLGDVMYFCILTCCIFRCDVFLCFRGWCWPTDQDNEL